MTRQKSRTLKKQQLCEHLRYHSSKYSLLVAAIVTILTIANWEINCQRLHYSKKKYEKVVVETSKIEP